MLKIAGVENENEFLKKFPTEESFFKAYPEASMLMPSNNMNYYQEGGEMMSQAQPAMAPDQQDVATQQQQIVQFIIELIQQNVPPEEIIQKLIEAGLPQEEAEQLVLAVMEKVQAEMQQGSAPEAGGMEAPPEQPMMQKGGKAYSGTYSAGVYYAGGGSTYLPDYSMMAMGGSYDNPGFKALPLEVQNKIKGSSDSGLTKFAAGGPQGGDQQQAMIQQLMSQIAQLLQQGVKENVIAKDLVKMGMSKEQAMQIITTTAKQLGGGKSSAPVMPMEVGMYGGYTEGGNVSKYKKGGVYDMTAQEIADLEKNGFKIQYV